MSDDDFQPETFGNKPVIALIGRPNVGKSTLFNQLSSHSGQKALVGPSQFLFAPISPTVAGITRDRSYGTSSWLGREFTVIDTGGLIISNSDSLSEQVKTQSLIALEEANVVFFLVDSKEGLTPADKEIARYLRHTQRDDVTIIVVVNKAEQLEDRDEEGENIRTFEQLGLGTPIGISAIHGDGFGDLLDKTVQSFPPPETFQHEEVETAEGISCSLLIPGEPSSIRVAIVGAPNVGKSSILNQILGQERSVVSDIAGTTKDPVDHLTTWKGRPMTLIDTAGIRRKGTHRLGIERLSVLWALRVVERAHVVVLMTEPEGGVSAFDQRIAQHILQHKKSVILVMNKWDKVREYPQAAQEYMNHILEKLHFLPWVPIVFTSAATRYHVNNLMDTVLEVFAERSRRIPTNNLFELLKTAVAKHHLNSKPNAKLKFKFAHQVMRYPPTFYLFFNKPQDVHPSFRRYLENSIRQVYPFKGTPIELHFRANEGNKKVERKSFKKRDKTPRPPPAGLKRRVQRYRFDPANPFGSKDKKK